MKVPILPVHTTLDATLDFEAVQGSLTALEAKFAALAYIAPTLEHSWANAGGAFATAGYLKDTFGFVHIRGLITGGEAAKSAFILPEKFRPSAAEQFTSFTGAVAVTFVEVTAAGLVIPNAGATSIRLSGMSFLAEG